MFTRSESYYIKKRKKLRKKIREFEKNTQWPNKVKAKKLWKMKAKYEALGRKWWNVHKVVQFEGADFGLDITDLPISLNDIRLSAWSTDPYTKFQKIEGSHEWKALRVLNDKSVKVEYRKDADGLVWQYLDGVKSTETPDSSEALGTTIEED